MTSAQEIIILQDFLKNPASRKYFDPFFSLCYRQTLGYLRYLKARGYQLPLDSISPERAFEDLAIDILGGFLQSQKNKPFHIIFDYYEREEIADFPTSDTEQLLDLFPILLRGFIKKELAKIYKQEKPQLDHLKRRFKDILSGPSYGNMKSRDKSAEYIYLKKNKNTLRKKAEPLFYEDLIQIADRAYLNSKTREEWCAMIFQILDQSGNLQNFIKKHEILKAVIAVNAKYVEIDGIQPSKPPSPNELSIRTAARDAIPIALQWSRQNTIQLFLNKGRISPSEAERFLQALNNYLTDFGYDSVTDPIPDYYREVMPEKDHSSYLKKHKYIFETVVNKNLEYFKEILKKNPTIRGFGCYSDIGTE